MKICKECWKRVEDLFWTETLFCCQECILKVPSTEWEIDHKLMITSDVIDKIAEIEWRDKEKISDYKKRFWIAFTTI